MAGNWCLIESDPGVFTELIERVGVKGVQVDELYTLDEEELRQRAPVYGLVFLFKHTREVQSQAPPVEHDLPGLFFARQLINNACATQAILSILLNAPDDVELGSTLSGFKDFAFSLDPEMRGLAISNSDEIREIHNSFARQDSFAMESRTAKEDDDVFHFVAYVPHGGRLYELDGLQTGPIDHGPCGEDWVGAVASVVQQRIERYQGEIRFNLMAVCGDKRVKLQNQIDECEATMMSLGDDAADEKGRLQAKLHGLHEELQDEEERRKRWTVENLRRKHNFIPLFLQLLKELARKKQLAVHVETAKRTAAERMSTAMEAAKKKSAGDK